MTILALRVALVAVLYLFLAIVMRGAIRGLRTAVPGRPAESARKVENRITGLRLVVREPGTSELEPGQLVELADGAVLGRSSRAEVVIADSSVSVTDLGSTNGTQVNETPVNGEMPLTANDVLTLGSVRLQVVTR